MGGRGPTLIPNDDPAVPMVLRPAEASPSVPRGPVLSILPPSLEGLFPDVQIKEAEAELQLMAKFWPTISDASGHFLYIRRIPKTNRYSYTSVLQYLLDRDALFGGYAAYREHVAIATAELDTPSPRNPAVFPVRDALDPNVGQFSRKGPDQSWKDAQNVYYTWTRKACQKHLGIADPHGGNVPGIVTAGKSKELSDALALAESIYKHPIHGGGNNFRPMKKDGIRLGSISEHGFGKAYDIDAAHNPQLKLAEWNAMLAYTGVTLSDANRRSWWETRHKELYDKIKEVSDEFAKKVADGKDPVPKIISGYATAHKNGFFNLPWAMVDALHQAKLKWGAGFETNVDLHHFEVPAKKSP